MTVYVLLREDQNEHGYVDTSITGVFREAGVARETETLQRLHARQDGLWWKMTRVLTASGRCRGESRNATWSNL